MQLNQQCQCLLDCSSIISYPIFSLCLLNSRRQTSYFCILAYIRIVHFFQDLFCHVILVEEQVLLNGNIASPKSTLRFHCEVTCFILKKQESTLYNEGISFRHQDPGERGLDLLFLGKIKTFLNKKWNVLTVLGKEKKKKTLNMAWIFPFFSAEPKLHFVVNQHILCKFEPVVFRTSFCMNAGPRWHGIASQTTHCHYWEW